MESLVDFQLHRVSPLRSGSRVAPGVVEQQFVRTDLNGDRRQMCGNVVQRRRASVRGIG
ncbi:hypothetical protein HDG32_003744 [Paraburkholderia sp. CI2]|nr:hypothetical protein [Paraburkholderia sp. CI2]